MAPNAMSSRGGSPANGSVSPRAEWWTALATGDSATAFLGTQGDPWDPQWDMFFALLGALSAQLLLAHVRDREMARMVTP